MSEEYDVVIIGAGNTNHKSGGYLTKAGLNVCLVEQAPYVGGGVITREVAAPGFKSDVCSTMHALIQTNPLIRDDELGLISKYGLEYIVPEEQNTILYPDETFFTFYKDLDRTCESIAKFSQKDAEEYKNLVDWCTPYLDILMDGMANPAPPFGSFVSMMDQSEEGRDLLRTLMLSGHDLCCDWFESDQIKIPMTRFSSEMLLSPRVKGTAIMVLMILPLMHQYGTMLPVGGSGALSEAMEKCILANGGTIKCDSTVEKVKVVGGEAKSVILEGGEEIVAKKAIMSNLHIKQLFPDMVGADNLPERFVTNVENIRGSDFGCMNQHLALHEAPKYTAGDDVNAFFVEFAPLPYEKYLRNFDNLEYGYMDVEMPLCVTQTEYDTTRAPEGKHVLYLYHYEPYAFADWKIVFSGF